MLDPVTPRGYLPAASGVFAHTGGRSYTDARPGVNPQSPPIPEFSYPEGGHT
jgi:hypothetical protein